MTTIKQLKKELDELHQPYAGLISADYPLGGSIEPYDIESEKELMEEQELGNNGEPIVDEGYADMVYDAMREEQLYA